MQVWRAFGGCAARARLAPGRTLFHCALCILHCALHTAPDFVDCVDSVDGVDRPPCGEASADPTAERFSSRSPGIGNTGHWQHWILATLLRPMVANVRLLPVANSSFQCMPVRFASLGGRAAAAFRPTRSRGGPLGIRSVARAACIPVQAPLPHVSVHVLPHFLAPRRRGGPQTGPLRRRSSETHPPSLAGSGLPRRGVPKCGATRRSPDAAVSRRSTCSARRSGT